MDINECYKVMQAEWVKTHNVVEGTVVKVLRKAKDYEMGRGTVWNEHLDSFVGEECTVSYCLGVYVWLHSSRLNTWREFPFFVLEVISHPETKEEHKEEPKPDNYIMMDGKKYMIGEACDEY